MKNETETRKIAVLIPGRIKPDYSYGSQVFEYQFVTVTPEGKVRNCSDSDDFTADFDDLMFRCQVSVGLCDNKPFAYTCEYRQIFTLDLRRAERCIKVLRKIEKANEKFPVRPETFGQYVALVARALGVQTVTQESVNEGARTSGWHDETEHVSWKVSDLQWLVDRQIGDFLAEHGERMACSAR